MIDARGKVLAAAAGSKRQVAKALLRVIDSAVDARQLTAGGRMPILNCPTLTAFRFQEGIWHAALTSPAEFSPQSSHSWIALASASSAAVGDEKARQSAANPPQDRRAAGKDPFEVPDGTIEELQKYIEGLNKIQPSSSLRPAIAELHQKRATAQLNACEKILAAKPTPEQAQAAVRIKIAALVLLGRLGDLTAQARLEATVDQVEKLGLKDLVRTVQLAVLENSGERAVAMKDDEYGQFVERLKSFLCGGPIDVAAARLAVNVGLGGGTVRPARPGRPRPTRN